MKNLIPLINEWFKEKAPYLRLLFYLEKQAESWFNTELLTMISTKISLKDIRTEVDYGDGQRLDIQYEADGKFINCETKVGYITKKTLPKLMNHLSDRNYNESVAKDFFKLENATKLGGEKYVLYLMYPKPPKFYWEEALAAQKEYFKHWVCLTNYDKYPDFYLLGIWKFNEGQYQFEREKDFQKNIFPYLTENTNK